MDISDVEVGMLLRSTGNNAFARAASYVSPDTLRTAADQIVRVTRVNRNAQTMTVRGIFYFGGENREASIYANPYYFEEAPADATLNITTPAPTRRLGKKPEGDEFIGIDHPGIQWLFEDMGRYADEQGYCSQYDLLSARLGIPGRPRDFSVSIVRDGLRFTANVRARSQAEANEIAEAKLDGSTPEPATTSAA